MSPESLRIHLSPESTPVGHSAENLSRIRRLALDLLRQDKSVKVGTKANRLKACLEESYPLKTLCRAFWMRLPLLPRNGDE